MAERKISDANVVSERLLPTPAEIKEQVPITPGAAATVMHGRQVIEDILDRRDPRLFVVVGPCSIHDLKAAKEYAEKLRVLADEVQDTMVLVMRVYFAKPRTSVGWKGFINDPYLDDSFRIDEGLLKARKLLWEVAELGLPAGTEALDSIFPQYVDDLLCWNAIGARTTESQTHREMASGLSTPVGFKNGTDGNVQVAVNALKSSAAPHHFLGINMQGQCVVLHTRGNRYGHIVLRGGSRPNYDSVSIAMCEKELRDGKLPVNVTVDCSHGNSLKDPSLQPLVFDNCINQIVEGNRSIVGLMLESNINFGQQELTRDLSSLKYGVSITDACIDWETTAETLRKAREKLGNTLTKRASAKS
ncbi:MAG: 3-deoxy-7-phosphoheptulonate synthase [Bdellovibrionota bacterium]